MKLSKLMLTAIVATGFIAVRADAEIIEKAIIKNNSKMVSVFANLSKKHKEIALSADQRAKYIALAQQEVTKRKEAMTGLNWNALCGIDMAFTISAAALTVGGLLSLIDGWKDRKNGDGAKIWKGGPLFIVGIGQAFRSVGDLLKAFLNKEKHEEAVEKAKKVLRKIEALPVPEQTTVA